MAGENRKEYLEREVQRLQSEVQYVQNVIAHLENQGVEVYNNRIPCVFEDTEVTRLRRQKEAHPPEIYQKSGEEILADLKQSLENRKTEFANCNSELAKLRQAD